jgi:hypothetical protein
MLGILRRIFVRDFGPPPLPDVAHQPTFPDQRIVETLYSDSKQERAFITVDETRSFRIYVQWWDTSDWKYWQKAFWYGHGSGSHTDTIERARNLAAEALRCSRKDG